MKTYIVASLPRSGTTSLSQMANLCGLKPMHVLTRSTFKQSIREGYNFYADTPFYLPMFLCGILETSENLNINFIYCHRDNVSHKKSLKKLRLQWSPSQSKKLKIDFFDRLGYNYIDNMFDDHYSHIEQIAQLYRIKMLNYSFDQGWEPFCNFVGTDIPNHNIPHLNTL